jgi:hypothetical protein
MAPTHLRRTLRIGARPWLVPLPFALWQILALGAEFLPGSPLTRNQVALMRRDNVPSVDCPGLLRLNITPTEINTFVSAGTKYSQDDDRILKG